MTQRQKNALRDEYYRSLQGTKASLNLFAAQIRLARVELIRGEVDISLGIGDKTIHSRITGKSVGQDALMGFLEDYICIQVGQTVRAIEEMNRVFPDLPKDVSEYPNAMVLDPFQVRPAIRRKRGLKAIFFTIRTLPIWLLSGKRPVS